jgi:tRNA modification GTPase
MIFMAAPRSYTREDVLELQCHGGPVPLERVFTLVVREGARPAGPGEFTRRAFLSGRIDLPQAEAALDIIRARTEEAGRLALRQLEGALSEKVGALRQRLLDICAEIEAHIDFPEEDIEPAGRDELVKGIKDTAGKTDSLAGGFLKGRLFREGVRTAIVGRPNVGKSSLLNKLLERDRAIVTPAPGTTRDVIEETLSIKGLPFIVMDTAGIRESHEMAESEGVRRSLGALEDADLVLAVFDMSGPLHEEDRLVLERTGKKKTVCVLNKSDLPQKAGTEAFGEKEKVLISAKHGDGLGDLKEAMHDKAIEGSHGGGEAESVIVTNARHRDSLVRASDALKRASAALGKGEPLELPALELREATEALGEIVGAISTEEILERIFSSFCIGK